MSTKKVRHLTDAEKKRGFVAPVRTQYVHAPCPASKAKDKHGAVMTLGTRFAEEMAEKPKLGQDRHDNPDGVPSAFCPTCAAQKPLGEFTWVEDGAVLGS